MTYTATSGSVEPVATTAVSDLFRLVVRNSETIVRLNECAEGLPNLYCIHSVAGDVTDYRSFAKKVESHLGVCGVQVPLNRMRTDGVASIEKLASRYARLISERQPSGPIFVGGFSAGAIIALEVAQKLILSGREVPLLVAYDGAPSNTNANFHKFNPLYIYRLMKNFIRCIAGGQIKEWIRDGLLWRFAFSFFLRPSGMEPITHGSTFYKNAMQLVTQRCGWKAEQVEFLRNMIDALSVYRATTYPGRVLVFETKFQPLFHAPQIADVWKNLATDYRLHDVDASHSTLFRNERAVADMASILIEEVSKIR